MTEHTLYVGDIEYLFFYIKDESAISGSITYHDVTTAGSITFRMQKYGESTVTLSLPMEVVTGTLGYVRVLATIPTSGKYSSEIEISETPQALTWKGPIYEVVDALG